MNIDEIKEIAKIVSENGLESIEITEKDTTIKMKMPVNADVSYNTEANRQIQQNKPLSEIHDSGVDFNNLKEIKSPMVGVFYSSPSPESEPFVKIGSIVKKGDVLCIIEAMKLMNEITSETDGEVVDICVENGQIIEFSQTLFKIF